ncbi:transmembrane protein 141 isoform X2 [Topomyia yanbarensis]|uniref:transmembrane protein 141 isoform X2 n=1 Tax=Topomyia yanbarensis TaxID=2498891 RepID=UPI00273B66AC|nr:transmembrane protein 141 isoform X2 [Topomyia yanbarensis]
MNDIRRLKEQQREKHPGFGFSATYFLQKLLAQKLPYQQKTGILVSSLIASIASYKVTSDRTKSCQAGWMAVEEKHTALSEEESEESV